MANTVLQIRVDNELKEKSSKLFKNLGLDISTAIRLFLTKSLIVSNLPFDISNVAEVGNINKNALKHTVDDLNKYMGLGKSLYEECSVEDYLKESRRGRY